MFNVFRVLGVFLGEFGIQGGGVISPQEMAGNKTAPIRASWCMIEKY